MSSYRDPALRGDVYPSEEEIDPAGATTPGPQPTPAPSPAPTPVPTPGPPPRLTGDGRT
ncbi:hypothetical protein [Micromonospora nigra]|uniref:hypothetical protein n=1 Tax=Micromonospora nigra TaxID=145857 RepID=UPI000AC52C5D|nr:hypothetical protein [Micromonospora nigra]